MIYTMNKCSSGEEKETHIVLPYAITVKFCMCSVCSSALLDDEIFSSRAHGASNVNVMTRLSRHVQRKG